MELNAEQLIKSRKWMINELKYNLSDYLDCGEIQCTKLTEDCANCFDLYDNDNDATIPDGLFEMAYKLAENFKNSIK